MDLNLAIYLRLNKMESDLTRDRTEEKNEALTGAQHL